MKKILCINPAISSLNIGDLIIAEGVKDQLSFLLNNSFVVDVSSHLPINRQFCKIFHSFDYRFVCGSNLLSSYLWNPFSRQWSISLYQKKMLSPIILVGVGWQKYEKQPDLFTKLFLKKILAKDYVHSVRDFQTKEMLKKCGIKNVVVTGCPTMWCLTKEKCRQISTKKSSKVVFTLTDYNKDYSHDKQLINILLDLYDEVFFWPQGIGDLEYLSELKCTNVHIVPPTLQSFDELLDSTDIDYVGTRLHGGIRSLQKNKRTLIISIDNRAKEIHKNTNLPILERSEIVKLKDLLLNDIILDIKIPEKEIEEWKLQFYPKNSLK